VNAEVFRSAKAECDRSGTGSIEGGVVGQWARFPLSGTLGVAHISRTPRWTKGRLQARTFGNSLLAGHLASDSTGSPGA